MKNVKTIYVIPIITFLVLAGAIIYQVINSDAERKHDLLSIERHTGVVDVYANKKQHNLGYVRFSNGRNEFLEYPYKIGYSISKKRGDSIEYIFRNGSIIQNNYLEEARKNGILK